MMDHNRDDKITMVEFQRGLLMAGLRPALTNEDRVISLRSAVP